MDAVITYVNGQDPVWQKEYSNTVGKAPLTKHFRDWGTLKYLLRGIEKHIPDIKNVYLIVSSPSQVPEYINQENVHIVLHKEIIPAAFLPTFNSTTIEMFIHRIEGLSERYLYFNDDMFPVGDIREEDFFKDGKVYFGISRHLFVNNVYKHTAKNADVLARKAAGCLSESPFFIRPQHTCSPMLKSKCEEIFNKCNQEIFQTLSRVRNSNNLCQYLFIDYLYFNGMIVKHRVSNKHISPAVHSIEKITGYIRTPETKMLNINDVEMDEAQYEKYRQKTDEAFSSHFPVPSRFENQ